MTHKQTVGRYGEELARRYLIRNGYQIIDQNLKISFKEVDIIAKKEGKIIFIEVKTRTSNIYGQADEAFSNRKMQNLKIALGGYILHENINEKNVQIDLIAIDINKKAGTAKIKHFKNVF